MQAQLNLSDPLAGRSIKSPQTTARAEPPRGSETRMAIPAPTYSIEIEQLPMVRKGGRTALLFDRMDSNDNGVLTRAELISYRLGPIAGDTQKSTSAMAAETMRLAGQLAESRLNAEAALVGEANKPWSIDFDSGTDPELPGEVEVSFGFESTTLPDGYAPSSLPESIVAALSVPALGPEPVAA